MTPVFVHFRWMFLELIRQPAYVVSTLAFPAIFYMIFAIPESNETAAANLLMASFSCFAFLGVLFLQLGVGVAQERKTSWYRYLHNLPLKPWHLLAARFLCSYFYAVLAALVIVVLALLWTPAALEASTWVQFWSVLIVAGLPFCFLGMALGYWTNEKTALPVGNMLYLPLTFAGGLWKPPDLLPQMLRGISEYLPTRHYGELAWAVVLDGQFQLQSVTVLLVFAAAGLVLFWQGTRRDLRFREFLA